MRSHVTRHALTPDPEHVPVRVRVTTLLTVLAALLPTVLLSEYRYHLNDATERYVSVMYNTRTA